jgi:hypothetical protein
MSLMGVFTPIKDQSKPALDGSTSTSPIMGGLHHQGLVEISP